ncbi:MAG: molybdate ABC transporter permease subunit [Steroidobacteraceae bacterium]
MFPADWLGAGEWQALRVSLIVGARAVAFTLPLAIATAWLLARGRFFGKTVIDALVHSPLVLPPVVVGYCLLLVFGIGTPIGGWLERWFDLRLPFTSTGASLAAGIVAFPIMVRAIRLSFEAIDPGLELAARSLGAGALDRFVHISLPMALPGILAALVVGFAISLGEFGAVITFAANIPGETQTLPLAIYSALQVPGGEAVALRLAIVALLIALAALLAAEALARISRRWSGR